MVVSLREVTDDNHDAVVALRVTPEQEQFVGSVRGALADAAEMPHCQPWYRAVYADDKPVGFVMLSWDMCPYMSARCHEARTMARSVAARCAAAASHAFA